MAEAARRSKKVGTIMGFAALAVVFLTVRVWFYQNEQVDLPENRTLFVAFWLLGAALGVGAFVARTRWFGAIPAVLAIGIGSFFPYTVSISRQEVAPAGIKAGQSMPHFTALDDRGQPFDSKSLDGEIVLMKFFRGHW